MLNDLWRIAEDEFDVRENKGFEGLCTQGSSYFHLRASFEEGLACAPQDEPYMRMPANVTLETPRHPYSKAGCYLPGVTGAHPLLREELVNLPSPLCFTLTLGDETLDMCESRVGRYYRELHLRDGVLTRALDWHTREGAVVTCVFTRFLCRHRPELLWQTLSLSADRPCVVRVAADIDTDVKTNGYNHFTDIRKSAADNGLSVTVTTDTGDTVTLEALLTAPQVFSPNGNRLEAALTLTPGQPVTIKRLTALGCSRDKAPIDLRALLEQGMASFDELRAQHERAWARLWQNSHVEITGDEEAQRALNIALYHLLRVSHPEETRVAVCAKGFAGEAYFGHFFWDSEMYLLPFYLYTHPASGRALTSYRVNSLAGARENAAAFGYDGAKYAWEASVDGREQCPNWQYCDHEVHINADVVFGLWHDFAATGDLDFLRRALPVMTETARYWLSRVTWRGDGTVTLDGVMGPDEYICFCDNNAYTNFMVKQALSITLRAAGLLGVSLGGDFVRRARAVMDGLPLPRTSEGLVAQCDHFEHYAEPEFEKYWPDRSRPYGTFVSQERNYRTKSLKQADVLMIPYLFPGTMDEETLAAHYDYYAPYTTHDSSLSCVIHAALLARLGRADEAKRLFDRALSIDLNGGAAEGIHIANCGGLWQAVVLGFCGMTPSYLASTPDFRPNLPETWSRVRFPLVFGGKRYDVTVTHEDISVTERETEQ